MNGCILLLCFVQAWCSLHDFDSQALLFFFLHHWKIRRSLRARLDLDHVVDIDDVSWTWFSISGQCRPHITFNLWCSYCNILAIIVQRGMTKTRKAHYHQCSVFAKQHPRPQGDKQPVTAWASSLMIMFNIGIQSTLRCPFTWKTGN